MSAAEWSRLRFLVVVLLALQLLTVVLVWLLNPVGQTSEAQFALLIAADLVAFSIVSYVGRNGIRGEAMKEAPVLAGSTVVMLFMVLTLLAEVY